MVGKVTKSYTPPKTVKAFILTRKQHNLILGPVGSGKSVGCIMKMAYENKLQEPCADGIRRTRWVIIRNTVKQLKDTTLKTWFQWFPDGAAGRFKVSDMAYQWKYDDVESEVLFRQLDNPEDIRNLLSLEITGAYFNELREIDPEIFDAVNSRLGRYPSIAADGVQATHPCIIADSNMPNMDSWLYTMIEEATPEQAAALAVHKQPGGMEPDAENKEYLPKNYYESMLTGRNQDFIDVHVHCKYGKSNFGKPVHQSFNESLHVAKEELFPEPGVVVVIGMDFGLTPAAVFKQMDGWGRVRTLDVVWTEDDYLERFLETKVLPLIKRKYTICPIFVMGDPSGNIRSADKGDSCFEMIESIGLPTSAAPTNDPSVRIGATERYLTRLAGDGKPAYLISSTCDHLIKALRGGYRYKKKRMGTSDDQFLPTPDKNIYSHTAEANQYGDMFFNSGVSEKRAKKLARKREFEESSITKYAPLDRVIGY